MKISLLSLLLLILVNSQILSQLPPSAQVMAKLTITDGREQVKELYFGVDPAGTDGIDVSLGESSLPPWPPAGAFEARYYLPIDNFSGLEASYFDFRNGVSPFSGQKEHRIAYQRGVGDSILIFWALPNEITGRLQDVVLGTIVDVQLSGSGSFLVPNPTAINQLKFTVTYNNATDVNEDPNQLIEFNLSQNYPNPFNPGTKIQYSISNNQFVQLKIFDILGKEIITLVNSEQSSGAYEVNFDGKSLTTGIYFYTITAGDYTETKSMILMK